MNSALTNRPCFEGLLVTARDLLVHRRYDVKVYMLGKSVVNVLNSSRHW